MICRVVCQLSSGLGSSFQTSSLWICSIRRVTRQSSHRLSPFSNSQTCPSGISARRFFRQRGQYMNTWIMVLPVCMVLLVRLKFALRRRSQRLLNAPPAMNAIGHGVRAHSKALRPLSHGKRNAIIREVVGCTFVVVLLVACFPTAIAFFVVSIIIRPSNGGFRKRLRSHILKKVLEGFQPACADSDSSQTIMLELFVVRMAATRLHLQPACVFWRYSTVATIAMRNNTVVAPWFARGRLTRNHLTFPKNDWVVRAESVNHDRLGSFHCISYGRQVQHVA